MIGAGATAESRELDPATHLSRFHARNTHGHHASDSSAQRLMYGGAGGWGSGPGGVNEGRKGRESELEISGAESRGEFACVVGAVGLRVPLTV